MAPWQGPTDPKVTQLDGKVTQLGGKVTQLRGVPKSAISHETHTFPREMEPWPDHMDPKVTQLGRKVTQLGGKVAQLGRSPNLPFARNILFQGKWHLGPAPRTQK